MGALDKLVDDLEYIKVSAQNGQVDDSRRRIAKAQEDLKRLISCLNDERDPDYLAAELAKLASEIPLTPALNPKKPYSAEALAGYRHELGEFVSFIPKSMGARKSEILENIKRAAGRVGADGYIAYLKSLPEDARKSEIDSKISTALDDLVDEDVVCDMIAETNAVGYYVDDYTITDTSLGDDICIVQVAWHISGDQLEDKAFYGDTASGNLEAHIDDAGEVTLHDVTGSIDEPYEPEEE